MKILLPWKPFKSEAGWKGFARTSYSDSTHWYIKPVDGRWVGRWFMNTDTNLYFDTTEEAMAHRDNEFREEGYLLIDSDEQWEKIKVLI